MTTQIKPDPPAPEPELTPQTRRKVSRRTAFTLAAVVALAGVALTLILATGAQEEATPADEQEPVMVGSSFVRAFGAFDAERARSYLAQDADISELVSSVGAGDVKGSREEFRLHISLLEANGYRQILDSCDETGSSGSGTTVLCWFDFHLLRSDQLGLGPYSDSYFELTVRDGEIARAAQHWEISDFSPQMWEPFANWVSSAYPKDAAVMYTDESHSGARLSEKSVRLWELRTEDYADFKAGKIDEVAEGFMEARNAYDAERAMSAIANGVVTAKLLYDNEIDPDMPALQLNRDQLAAAFAVERLYEVRYEPFVCRPSGKAEVTCAYRVESRLSRIEGSRPIKSRVRLGFREGRIDHLSFPWLNVSFPSGLPAEGAGFVRWAMHKHQRAGQRLFRWMGQERVLNLNPESIDLLAGYLEEYERFSAR
jgi:hypothetical protein